DFTEKIFIRDGVEELPERMTDVMTGLTLQLSTTTGSPTRKFIGSSQDLMFSLMFGPDTVLADFVASDYVQFSEWTDGLNMLFDKNIGSRDTAEFTEIGVKVKLLDLSGERVEIPQSVEVPRELPVVEIDFIMMILFLRVWHNLLV
ncbi:1632_t:CDS:2, partial [Racocetra persica]